jgi:hypothetical protein
MVDNNINTNIKSKLLRVFEIINCMLELIITLNIVINTISITDSAYLHKAKTIGTVSRACPKL